MNLPKVGDIIWVDWEHPQDDWHVFRVGSQVGERFGSSPEMTLSPVSYNDPDMGWSIGDEVPFVVDFSEIVSWRMATEEELKPRHLNSLGGPDDAHYCKLGVQPIEATEAWSKTWPNKITYHLGESVAAIARCGTKGQIVRDLRKAHFLLERAIKIIEAGDR